MHTVELLEEACRVAKKLGYEIRQEYLDGSRGGACEFGGKKWIFIDLSLNAMEQLDQVTEAIRDDPKLLEIRPPETLKMYLDLRRAA
ncbi:MAG: hypothetical protein ACI9G1_000934 [Pirellulaceae bacterium]|jgi:hypothetical protein